MFEKHETMIMQLDQAGNHALLTTPQACRQHLMAIIDDGKAALREFPALATDLFVKDISNRVKALRNLDLAHLPPALTMRPGEDSDTHLDRCFAVYSTFE